MIEVDERPLGPEPEPELFATDHLAGPFEQGGQQGKRLIGERCVAALRSAVVPTWGRTRMVQSGTPLAREAIAAWRASGRPTRL